MKNVNANSLSLILIGSLGLLVAILIGGSFFAATTLQKQSNDATHAAIDAEISKGDRVRLEQLKQYLQKNSASIDQTHDLTQGLGTYDQNTIVAAVNSYASQARVTISGFDFDTSTTPAAGATPATGAATSSANTVNVTLASPVRYTDFIVFLKLLEQGRMPAQVTGGSISAQSDNPELISVDQLTIKVAK